MPISNKFIMMKFLKILAAILIFAAPKSGFAQNLGDKLLGVYHAVEEGRESKIRFTREAKQSLIIADTPSEVFVPPVMASIFLLNFW